MVIEEFVKWLKQIDNLNRKELGLAYARIRIKIDKLDNPDDGIRRCIHGEPVDSDPVCIECQRVTQVGMCYHSVMKDECEECRKTLPMYLLEKFKVK